MSRHIPAKEKAPDWLSALQTAKDGKLIFTTYKNRRIALLIRSNRLLAAQVLPEESVIGAIYIGRIRKKMPNLNAYFVEIENGEICFLPMKETDAVGLFKEGDELPVQITREAQKTKQASVTAYISLSNEYAALRVGSPKIGYSNKLSAERKEEIKGWLKEAKMLDPNGCFCAPEGMLRGRFSTFGAVIRTQAGACSKEEFLLNLQSLVADFTELLQNASHRTCFSCVRKAKTSYEAIFDKMVYPYEYNEIVTDDQELYSLLKAFCEQRLPQKELRLYQDAQFPLGKLYSLETKMELALERRVWLKSGGYLVIDPTEALTVIDVNSGKYDAKKPSEDTVLQINREAAEEIALQLRLRNLSGMIIVDFINMKSSQNNEEILNYLKSIVRHDKLKTIVHDMTALGLVEITRKKQYKTLAEQIK